MLFLFTMHQNAQDKQSMAGGEGPTVLNAHEVMVISITTI
jgi:hypothetical protein